MMRRLTKPLIAVVAGLALLFLSALPSGASTGTVNSGTLSVNLLPALNVNLAPGTGPCPGASALSLSATVSPGNVVSTNLSIADGAFTYSGATYFLDGITASATTGSVTDNASPANDPVSTGPFSSSSGNIYPETSTGSCVPDTSAPVCSGVSLSAAAPVLSLAGNFPDTSGGVTLASPDITGTAVVSGSGRIAASGCASPFSALNNRTLTISNMNVTFV